MRTLNRRSISDSKIEDWNRFVEQIMCSAIADSLCLLRNWLSAFSTKERESKEEVEMAECELSARDGV